MLITSTYKAHAKHHPDRIALQSDTEQVSYSKWYEEVRRTAAWLIENSPSNKRIGILTDHPLHFLQMFASAANAGLIAVPLNTRWHSQELVEHVMKFDINLIVIDSRLQRRLDGSQGTVKIIEAIIDETASTPQQTDSPVIDGDLPFYMGFTSGSTGKPKAFLRSHASWVASFACNVKDFHMTDKEYAAVPGSLFHSHFLYGAISTLYLGGTVFLNETFHPDRLLSSLHVFPITTIYVVPTMVEALLKEDGNVNKHVKVISSGAKWGNHAKEKLKSKFPNFSLWEFYGASELSYVSVLNESDNKPLSVGKPCHNVTVEIRGNDGSHVEREQTGKIYVKSPLQFMGYLTEKGKLDRPGENGWMTVGDMGYLDHDGFLYIAGREKHMILYGAINIFPEEIETVLTAHPTVEEAAVVGIPDPYWGQLVGAAIVGNVNTHELRSFCKKHLSGYKIPRRWYVVDALPHTVSGKVAKNDLIRVIAND